MLISKTLNVKQKGALVYLTFPLFENEGIKHAFTTKMGGVSGGDFATFNTGFDRGDSRENVYENFRRLCEAIGIDEKNLVFSKQTHTNFVRTVTADDIGKGITKPLDYTDVDGLISSLPGVGLVTQYADCVPLMFYDKRKRVIATSHAGWRGTVAEIGRVTVEKMQKEFGSDPCDIIAGIGPSIGDCCYEVDDPVVDEFRKIPYIDLSAILKEKGGGKDMLDLKTANKIILRKAGIPEENIDVADLCTCCNHEYLHSHRYTAGKRGNLGLIISL